MLSTEREIEIRKWDGDLFSKELLAEIDRLRTELKIIKIDFLKKADQLTNMSGPLFDEGEWIRKYFYTKQYVID